MTGGPHAPGSADDPETLSVYGRLLKDRAAREEGALRDELLNSAIAAYRRASDLSHASYPLINAATLAFLAGPDPLTTVGIVSGGAQREVHQAIAAGLDAYVTGDATEWVMATARENRIHYLAVGHHAGERLGVLALGEHLARELGLEVTFVDVPNPV